MKAPPAKAKNGAMRIPTTGARPPAPRPGKIVPPRPAFPSKRQPPAAATFAAGLPLVVGKRFESVRAFLQKQTDVAESVYFFGPKAGWGLRYLVAGKPLASLLVIGATPVGVLAIDQAAGAVIDWNALTPIAQRAKKSAHGTPSLYWINLPLDGAGAADMKVLLKAKLAALRGPPADAKPAH